VPRSSSWRLSQPKARQRLRVDRSCRSMTRATDTAPDIFRGRCRVQAMRNARSGEVPGARWGRGFVPAGTSDLVSIVADGMTQDAALPAASPGIRSSALLTRPRETEPEAVPKGVEITVEPDDSFSGLTEHSLSLSGCFPERSRILPGEIHRWAKQKGGGEERAFPASLQDQPCESN
jgi:hypothetical protein